MITARVTLVTCVWQRHELTRVFWMAAQWLRERWAAQGIALDFVAAASLDSDVALAEEFGVHVVKLPNHPLGRKFNAATQASQDHEPDQILIMGSDDFMCPRVADTLAEAVHAHEDVGFRDIYFADLLSNQARYLKGYGSQKRSLEPVGPGTLHSCEILDRLKWRLWEDDKHHGMDGSRFRTLQANNALPALRHLKEIDGVLLDVKTPVNLWPFDRRRKAPWMTPSERDAMWAKLPAVVRDNMPWPEDFLCVPA